MKFLIETGRESHTSSFQSFQAKFVGGPNDGKFLYEVKRNVLSTEWIKNDRHQTVVKTIYELPSGTQILLDYKSFEGKIRLIIRLDENVEVQEKEISNCRLRSWTVKGRFIVERDLVSEKEAALKASQEEGF